MKFNIILGLVASVIAMSSSKKSSRSNNNWFNNPNSSYYVVNNDSLKQKLDYELKLIQDDNSYTNSKDNIKTGSESYFIAWLNYEFQLPWEKIKEERKSYYQAIGLNESNWDDPTSSDSFNVIIDTDWNQLNNKFRIPLENIGYNNRIWKNYDLFPIKNENEPDQVIISVNYNFANANQLQSYYKQSPTTLSRNT